MLPTALSWIRRDGAKLDASTRRGLMSAYRPPWWLPCWFHTLWFWIAGRFAHLPVIVGVDGECSHLHEVLKRYRCRCRHDLASLGCVCIHARIGALQEICNCEGVTQVWLDGEVRALLDSAVPSAGAIRAVSRYSGAGVTIAVVDTGIQPHPDFGDRIVGFADFVGKRTASYDDNGHGTHVAGCAAGDGGRSGGIYSGPAPRARLVGVKVLNKFGSGTMSGLLAGINWVVANRDRYGIRILSISLGATAGRSCVEDPLCQAVGRAWAAGLVVVVAAGNEGPETGTVSSPGINPQVITVGAMDDQGNPERADDALAPFSSRGPAPDGSHKPDIVAPGVAITATRARGSYIDKAQPGARIGDWYLSLSGTSMATPIVSGIAALLLEAKPAFTPQQVKARLQATAQDRGLLPDEQGAGYVDADRLLGL